MIYPTLQARAPHIRDTYTSGPIEPISAEVGVMAHKSGFMRPSLNG